MLHRLLYANDEGFRPFLYVVADKYIDDAFDFEGSRDIDRLYVCMRMSGSDKSSVQRVSTDGNVIDKTCAPGQEGVILFSRDGYPDVWRRCRHQ
jgi:hypothetical protein